MKKSHVWPFGFGGSVLQRGGEGGPAVNIEPVVLVRNWRRVLAAHGQSVSRRGAVLKEQEE